MQIKNFSKYLQNLVKKNKPILAFNVINLETLKAVIKAGEETKVPLIIQLTPSAIEYANYDLFIPAVKKAIQNSKAKFALHLDHCQDLKLIKKAIKDGFNSIMYDGSILPIEENIEFSNKVKKIALNTVLELEIGKIGGKEENVVEQNVEILDIKDIEFFYQKTKSELLAIAFGTSHGIYKKEANLNFEILKKFKKKFPHAALVMHGTSGLEIQDIQKSIKAGITKINIATDLLISYTEAFQNFVNKNPKIYDLRKINNYAIDKTKEKVIFYINNLVLN
ncbi:class II fructose-bisphosphate aldolase [Mesomycoplasma neurolyticum]|uniref:Probable fructose-bisphosphate aldolase n=1 Tax=Mesomycoplasma neurolyticum TaxID=2120 RepID=A0A449A6P4_9BACT|nr:class II fructose-bisphosphate aldolase [Mesomycoplasma neurolyticum]VEU59833.1 Probable fructose-bisphosphate aldolase [Mesomycoplasma neurolyticum]